MITLLLPAPPPARATPTFWAQATATEAATAADTISAWRWAVTARVPLTRALVSSSRARVSAEIRLTPAAKPNDTPTATLPDGAKEAATDTPTTTALVRL